MNKKLKLIPHKIIVNDLTSDYNSVTQIASFRMENMFLRSLIDERKKKCLINRKPSTETKSVVVVQYNKFFFAGIMAFRWSYSHKTVHFVRILKQKIRMN